MNEPTNSAGSKFLMIFVAGLAIASGSASTCFADQAEKEPSVCEIYSDYLASQCVAPTALDKTTSHEIRKGYSVASCREQAVSMILQSDENAEASCEVAGAGNNLLLQSKVAD